MGLNGTKHVPNEWFLRDARESKRFGKKKEGKGKEGGRPRGA